MENSRRSFIKISTLGTGALTLAPALLTGENVTTVKNDTPVLLTKSPTYCEICFWKCAAWVYKDEKDQIVKIKGHEDDPHCFGRLCPRGTGGPGIYHDEDRLKKPLIRISNNGVSEFKEASWEEALDLIATKMTAIKETYGPESMALLKHGTPGKHLEHLFKAYGSNTIAEPAYAQCRGPRETGFGLTFGSWVGSPEPTDIENTKCLVLIGSHLGENMHNSQVQELSKAIERKADIITVDPRFSTVASKSSHWLAIKPSTDMALLLSWMHVLIQEGIYQKAYVKKYGLGFDKLEKHVEKYSPEWAYGITGIDPVTIRKTARKMAAAAPSVIVHPGRHVTWYGDDSQRSRAVAILNGLLGSWGNRGGFYMKEKLSIPSYPHPPYPSTQWDWKDLAKKYPFAEMGNTTETIKASLPGHYSGKRVRAWLVAGTNPISAIPETKVLKEAMEALEFMVVVDTMPSEITGYADVVLPECTYLERYDALRSSPGRKPTIALRSPAVPPKYESKPAWWISKEIGTRLGLNEHFSFESYEEVLDWQLKKLNSSLKEMKLLGVKEYPRKQKELYWSENKKNELPTTSGKIEFYSRELAAAGFDPMPTYKDHGTIPEGHYRLNYGRSPVHTFSRTANNPLLHQLCDENHLWVHPKIAAKENLRNGQEVRLQTTDNGSSHFSIKVRITERIRPDSVYMYHGFGHDQIQLSRANKKGINDTKLMSKVAIDPLMGGTGMRNNFVKIIKVESRKQQSS